MRARTSERTPDPLAGAPTGARTVRASTFDWPAWRPAPLRLLAAAAVAAYAIDLAVQPHGADRVLAVLLVAETAALLPWRLPRITRSGRSFWAESAIALISPAGAIVVSALVRPEWVTATAQPWWFLAALALVAVLILADGVNPRAAFAGELSFFAGPTPASFRRARLTTVGIGTVGEEAAFRGPLLLASTGPLLAVLGALAFIARHHVQPGTNGRGTIRATAVEIVGAAGFLALTVLSGSLYPALVAHLLFNAPGFAVEARRESDPR